MRKEYELPRIAPLDPAEVGRICAGEVVERPLSVVKELIENALDAGATRITIELTDGGKRLIRVVDDGHGIAYDDLPLAIRPHHTSKIRCLDDVFALVTLGFRGEALGSIATVANLALTSRTADDDLGGRIEVNGGSLESHTRAAFQRGTEVEVRNLFFNTPARLKFLKSAQSETGRITQLITGYTLAYPEVKWELTSQGATRISTDGDGDLKAVLADLVGPDAGGHLAEIDFEFPPSAVTGYISEPSYYRHNRQRQWFFINRRPVENKLLYKAVDDAIREHISPGRFPYGAFFLELPPEEIDVNVHPMKREVNFAQPQSVYSLLATAVRRALGAAAGQRQHTLSRGLSAVVERTAPHVESDAPPGQRAIPVYEEGQRIAPLEFPAERRTGAGRPYPTPPAATTAGAGDALRHPAVPTLQPPLPPDQPQSAAPAAPQVIEPVPVEELSLGLIAQIADSYLVVTTGREVYLIDQHSAHERVLFEDLYARLRDKAAGPRQRLLFPMLVSLTPGEAETATEHLPALNTLGFDCEVGAGDNLVVNEVPLELAGRVTAELVHGVLTELEETGGSALLEDRVKALAASLACRAAIKAGDRLPPDERYELVRQLLSRASTLSCPHGRPTVIRLGTAELERMFLR